MIGRIPRGDRIWAIGLVAGLLLASGGAAPDEPPGPAPTAEAVLRRMADHFAAAKSFAVAVEHRQKMGFLPVTSRVAVAIERPARFAIRSAGKTPGIDLVSDGATMTMAVAGWKRYIPGPAPASVAEMAADPMAMGVMMASLQGALIGELSSADPYKSLMEGVTSSTYVGPEVLDGAKAHHLKFVQPQFDWEVWVAAEGPPLPLKATVELPAQGQGFFASKNQITNTYDDWKVDAPIDPKTFAYEPPAGFEKADSLQAAMESAMPVAMAAARAMAKAKQPKSPLIGRPAPAIGLKMPGAGDFRLEDHRDKDVVMVDFWATWCGPCVLELPLLAEVAEAYRDKGVAFVAVNLREPAEVIEKFQASKHLKFPVALDPDGEVGDAYGAQAIPMLVVIDKAGIVRAVHVGYDPAIKATLGKELDALLAGQGLAP